MPQTSQSPKHPSPSSVTLNVLYHANFIFLDHNLNIKLFAIGSISYSNTLDQIKNLPTYLKRIAPSKF